MAIKLLKIENGSKIKTYICATTDSTGSYPTNADCDALSIMIVKNESLKEVSHYCVFDGVDWNRMP